MDADVDADTYPYTGDEYSLFWVRCGSFDGVLARVKGCIDDFPSTAASALDKNKSHTYVQATGQLSKPCCVSMDTMGTVTSVKSWPPLP